MTSVSYTGIADVRVLTASDMKKLGVEDFKKTEFHRGQVVEVSDEVARVLLEHKEFKGQFSDAGTGGQQDSLLDEPELATDDNTPPPDHEGDTTTPTAKTRTSGSTSRRATR